MNLFLHECRLSDIPEIVKLHIYGLKDGVLYIIGEKPLNEMYLTLLKYKNPIIVASIDEKLLGYVTVLKYKISIFKIINWYGWINVFFSILKSPKLAYRVAETLQFARSSDKAVLAHCGGRKVLELSHFVVADEHRSHGVGKKLIDMVQEVARIFDIQYIYTTTHNKKLANFYIKAHSANVICSRVVGGKLYQCLIWPCA